MTVQIPLYRKGRASALWSTRRTDYDLVANLRGARSAGDAAMRAAEEYDPNFALKLSACFDKGQADRLLDDWLLRRVAVLKRTQLKLRQLWERGRFLNGARRTAPPLAPK
jgi:hypothetical protein